MSATYLDQPDIVYEYQKDSFMEPLLQSDIDLDCAMIEDINEAIEDLPKIKLGICAMNKKTKSQPMQEILTRISRFDFVEIIIFSDHVIKNEPVEKWPICDALISFYSTGFPLSKAISYSELRKPFVVNDLEMQCTLKDRCIVYNLLESANIEMPRYAVLRRDENGTPINTDFIELEDSIQIGNMVFQKPFVEKPIDAEDHNVFIYFPTSAGGGSQRLFRKVGSRSSIYSAESSVRKYGSYVYEDFVHTDGTDVKIYTVGPEYAHAEARKSPSLDGKVERDSQGKEIRYPVILNPYEKEIAHKVCKLFKQTVCGFDLLRTHGKSFVCDVNGFSFVKTSKKYYDDCAQVLVNIILQQLAPQLYKPYEIETDSEDRFMTDTLEGTMLELRCVVGIIRHGDRTPKQKLKMEVRHPKFIDLFNRNSKSHKKKLKLKQPKQLQEVLDITRSLLEEIDQGKTMFEKPHKISQLKNVLEMYGHFSGINRKIQLKYLGPVHEKSDGNSASTDGNDEQHLETKEEAILLIMKWGGELTQAGRVQAEDLGRAFRCIYPSGDGAYSAIPGCGLLRLHSTYRHDLKIYASDEGRVQMTAGAFAKGFLALEGELTPILVHLVRSDKNTTEMLDTSDQATKFMAKVKHKLHDLMQVDRDFTEEDFKKLSPTNAPSLVKAMKEVKNPRQMCAKLSGLVHSLTKHLKEIMSSKAYKPRDPFLYHDETLELMTHRWTKLDKDFKLKNGMYDISLIPDIYDSIKYDMQHNSVLGLENTEELYKCAKSLADIVIPQEYGLTSDQKVKISQTICQRLLRKIQGDLTHADVTDTFTRLNPKYSQSVISPHRHVRTRLYFTSESHVHSIVNALRYGNLFEGNDMPDFQWKRALDYLAKVPELNYMTQIIIMLYEDPTADITEDKRFHIEIHFSPGAKIEMENSTHRGKSAEPKKSRPVSHIGEDHPTPDGSEHGKYNTTSRESPDQEKSLPQEIPGRDYHEDSTDVDNEKSRSTIGQNDLEDSMGSPVNNPVLSEEPPSEPTSKGFDRRRRKSGLETVLFRIKSESDADDMTGLILEGTKQSLSDSDMHRETNDKKSSKNDDDDDYEGHVKEDAWERPLERARSQSTSCLEDVTIDETGEQQTRSKPAKDDGENICSQSTDALDLQTTSVRTMPTAVKSDSVVLSCRQTAIQDNINLEERPSSCPSSKKGGRKGARFSTGTLFYMPAIRAVTKKLSMQVHGALRFKPPIPPSDSSKPPVSEFYDQAISSVESIDALLTLHDRCPLRTMERFLVELTEDPNAESDVSTPATTPTRKNKFKKLSAPSSSQKHPLDRNDSILAIEGLDVSDSKS